MRRTYFRYQEIKGMKNTNTMTYNLEAEQSILGCILIDNELAAEVLSALPYKYAKEFVLKALELLPYGCRCCMFLKLTFLEGKARYEEIFKHTPPRAVYVLSERLQCAKNGDFESYKNSAIAYAWYVWQKGWTGKTVIGWI